MKRLLSCLLCLALLMTFGTAAAEGTVHIRITAEADSEQMGLYLRGMGYADETADQMARVLTDFFGAAAADLYSGQNGFRAVFGLSGTALIDADARYTDGGLLLSTTLLPGILVRLSEPDTVASAAWTDVDLLTLLAAMGDMQKLADEWLQSLAAKETYGAFAGDAFTGGTSCVTRSFDDRDVGVFCLNAVSLLEKIFASAEAGLTEETAAWIRTLREELTAMSTRNANRYILREIFDGSGRQVGRTVTVLQGDDQIATLSIGYDAENISRCVLGFGWADSVYFVDITGGELTEAYPNAILSGAAVRVLTDPERLGFAAACTDPANILMHLDIEKVTMELGENGSFALSSEIGLKIGGMPALKEKTDIAVRGGVFSMTSAASLAGSDMPLLTVTAAQTDDPAPDDAWPEDAKTVTADDADALQAALREGLADLAATLVRVAPPSLLTLLFAQ
ncbi:MAG: hypothetical protein IJK28_12275 [Clostridia bacterium]|nr:hypothetical protein [Clostridia bacterium]